MIAAVCSAPCALQRRTESGLQARPLFFLVTNPPGNAGKLIPAKKSSGFSIRKAGAFAGFFLRCLLIP